MLRTSSQPISQRVGSPPGARNRRKKEQEQEKNPKSRRRVCSKATQPIRKQVLFYWISQIVLALLVVKLTDRIRQSGSLPVRLTWNLLLLSFFSLERDITSLFARGRPTFFSPQGLPRRFEAFGDACVFLPSRVFTFILKSIWCFTLLLGVMGWERYKTRENEFGKKYMRDIIYILPISFSRVVRTVKYRSSISSRPTAQAPRAWAINGPENTRSLSWSRTSSSIKRRYMLRLFW